MIVGKVIDMVKISDTIVHLLGYINPKQWADAIKIADEYGELDISEIYTLIKDQEERYGGGISDEIVSILCDWKTKSRDGNMLYQRVAKHFGIECKHDWENDIDGYTYCKLCGTKHPDSVPEQDTDSLQDSRADLFNSNGTRKVDY